MASGGTGPAPEEESRPGLRYSLAACGPCSACSLSSPRALLAPADRAAATAGAGAQPVFLTVFGPNVPGSTAVPFTATGTVKHRIVLPDITGAPLESRYTP